MSNAPVLAKMVQPGDVIAGKYRIDRVLGHGGMGAVHLGVHVVTGKRFAIKTLLPTVAQNASVMQRFVREAQASARIGHRNVVEVLDVGDWEGSLYLVMELLHGESLASYVGRAAPMPLADVMALMTRVFRGLEAAHAKGVIHRDLKPDNIYLCVDESGEPAEPKLLDFGIAKVADATHQATGTGQSMGTVAYMPPEQMKGARDVTPASDVFALGNVIYECLTGDLPYDADSLPELVLKMHSEPPAPLGIKRPDLPAEFCAIVMRMLAHRPEDRPQSVAELTSAMIPFGLGDAALPLPRPIAVPIAEPSTPSPLDPTVPAPQATAVYANAPSSIADAEPVKAAVTQPTTDPSTGTKAWVGLGATLVLALAIGIGAKVRAPAEPSPTVGRAEGDDAGAPLADAGASTVTGDALDVASDAGPADTSLASLIAATNPYRPVRAPRHRQPLGCPTERELPDASMGGVDAALASSAPSEQCLRPSAARRSLAADDPPREIQEHEVTWAELATWARNVPMGVWLAADPATKQSEPALFRGEVAEDWKARPAFGVPRHVATSFCAAIGARLPEEKELETAARARHAEPGWGNAPWASTSVVLGSQVWSFMRRGAVPPAIRTGAMDATIADEPIYDLVGSVREWSSMTYETDEGEALAAPAEGLHWGVIRGLPMWLPEGWPRMGGTLSRVIVVPGAYRDRACYATTEPLHARSACADAVPGYEASLREIGFRCLRMVEAR